MLSDIITTDIRQKLIEETKRKNVLSLPRVDKVVINCRVPEARESAEGLTAATEEIVAITGQKPSLARAKKSVATFKLRQGDPLALKVTLRGKRMYDFLDKLFNLVLPRLRDFKGLSNTAFDNEGNYSMTLRDHTYFPEINLDRITKIRSIQVTIKTTASSQSEAKMLLSALGLPFAKS